MAMAAESPLASSNNIEPPSHSSSSNMVIPLLRIPGAAAAAVQDDKKLTNKRKSVPMRSPRCENHCSTPGIVFQMSSSSFPLDSATASDPTGVAEVQFKVIFYPEVQTHPFLNPGSVSSPTPTLYYLPSPQQLQSASTISSFTSASLSSSSSHHHASTSNHQAQAAARQQRHHAAAGTAGVKTMSTRAGDPHHLAPTVGSLATLSGTLRHERAHGNQTGFSSASGSEHWQGEEGSSSEYHKRISKPTHHQRRGSDSENEAGSEGDSEDEDSEYLDRHNPLERFSEKSLPLPEQYHVMPSFSYLHNKRPSFSDDSGPSPSPQKKFKMDQDGKEKEKKRGRGRGKATPDQKKPAGPGRQPGTIKPLKPRNQQSQPSLYKSTHAKNDEAMNMMAANSLFYLSEVPRRAKTAAHSAISQQVDYPGADGESFHPNVGHRFSKEEREEDFSSSLSNEEGGASEESSLSPLKASHRQGHRRHRPKGFGMNSPNVKKVCASCGTKETPYWRDGWGCVTLCNACGIRYQKYKLKCNNCTYIPRKEETHNIQCARCGSFDIK